MGWPCANALDLEEKADLVLLCTSSDPTDYARRAILADASADPRTREDAPWKRRFEAEIIRYVRNLVRIFLAPSCASCELNLTFPSSPEAFRNRSHRCSCTKRQRPCGLRPLPS